MSELKPCPFCGHDKIYVGIEHVFYIALCSACSASVCGDTEIEAVDKWNKRAVDCGKCGLALSHNVNIDSAPIEHVVTTHVPCDTSNISATPSAGFPAICHECPFGAGSLIDLWDNEKDAEYDKM